MGKWLKDPKFLTYEIKNRVATITLNRPEKRNAISPDLAREIQTALQESDDRTEVRCVVIQGAGKDFCAGYDLNAYAGSQTDYNPDEYRGRTAFDDDVWHLRQSSMMRLQAFDMFKPVIAKVHGNCLAGGTDLALMCDMIVAANDARIGFPATRSIGSPANHMWVYHCGPQWAKRLLITGDAIRGKDAAKVGLVMKAVPKEKLDGEVELLSKRVASVESDLAACNKRIVNMAMELMGSRTMQRMASEMDGRAHLSKAFNGFFETTKAKGLKAALHERDAPFGDGEAKFEEPSV
jgi:enoyl-CoA hydratase